MSYNILFIIPDIILILICIKEYTNMEKCKSIFTCDNCGRFLHTIQYGDKCTKCHRTINIRSESWEHFMIFRYTYIDANNKRYRYRYKEYEKWFIIDIAICIIGIIALTLMSISGILDIVG